ncbi:hypothetical protein GS636_06865 [Ruegeria sp. HKCCD4884]|uniref:asparagine synthase-related protein n=1 Tax=Ruegeria sp. HKCCD4884 TaxID=2683022 RepID=UPI001492191D|nr:asparagine synthase-related protein [Ruegeria sp. HKCCD4884]NOD92502.1 hypothetical protein [Ruegeria sp. HKCCD4884]
MCGIFFASRKLTDFESAAVENVLIRRGTEGPAWEILDNGWTLGHSLLPVRGSFPVRQPLPVRSGFLMFTGELWDSEEDASDTLELAARVETLGFQRTVSSSKGMWALVYVDTESQSVQFCTDWIGEQPLHYCVYEGELFIASELKALVLCGVPFHKIEHVKPGCLYRFSSELSMDRYSHLTSSARNETIDPISIRHHLEKAVEATCTRADLQKVGLLISGGLDSTIIAHHAAKLGVRKAWTVATSPQCSDAISAGKVAQKLGLDWELMCVEPVAVELAIIASEVRNRSVLEESCLHIPLAKHIADCGVRVLLTGAGADELFIGYSHLLRRLPRDALQERFLNDYHKLDLRALNKVYGGYSIELRSPFLHPDVVHLALDMAPRTLIGPKTQLKWPLRVAYRDELGEICDKPKLIARETMGAKAWFAERYSDGARAFHRLWRDTLSDPEKILDLLPHVSREHSIHQSIVLR